MATRINLALLVGLTCFASLPKAPASLPEANAVTGVLDAQRAVANLPRGIPGDWWAKVQHDIQQSEYHITWQEQTAMADPSASPRHAPAAAYQAPNRAHSFRTYFTPDGVRLVPRTQEGEGGNSSVWEWGLKLTAYGETLQPAPPAELSVSANRIE
jgi:hypothetical protein